MIIFKQLQGFSVTTIFCRMLNLVC